jgi:hypothetical protein
MNRHPARLTVLFVALAVAALITACGAGEVVTTRSVKIVGDSLSDGRTFGAKTTVQDRCRATPIALVATIPGLRGAAAG